MFFSRRLFITSLTHTGIAVGFTPLLMANGEAGVSVEALQREISSYGTVIGMEESGRRIEVQVRIREIDKLPEACRAFSRAGAVYARGNDLQFDDGPRRIRIRNQV